MQRSFPCGCPAKKQHPGEVKAEAKRSSSRPLSRQLRWESNRTRSRSKGVCRRTKAAIGYSDQIAGSERTIQLDLKWVRWEAYKRYHAVYVSELGVHWTYCGRSIRPGAVLDEREQPPAQCRHCRLRLRSSYLVPDQLKALRIGQGLPVRE
jgi:hypothetical protein